MRKDLTIYSGLLLGGLALAYYASLPAEAGSEVGKEWFSIEPKSLTALTYESPDVKVLIEPRAEGRGYFVNATEKKKVPSEGGGETEKLESTKFKANDKLASLMEWLKPLRAVRVVGPLKDHDATEFGVGDGAATLEVRGEGDKGLTLKLGKRSYGSRNLFALDTQKQQIILVNGTPLENLEKASQRLFEREIMKLDLGEVKKATIKSGDIEVTWDHSERDGQGDLQWREDRDGATPKPSYKSWMDKLASLRVERYADDAEAPLLASEPAVISVTFLGGSKTFDTVVLKKLGAGKLAASDDPNPTYWLRTDYLGTFVKVNSNRAEVIVKDAPEVLGDKS